MHFWTKYIVTNPEVDDADLPLPEHRIFDDEGNVRQATVAQVRSFLQHAKASVRKGPSLDLKRRAALLRAVSARWTRRIPALVSPNASTSDEEDAAPIKSPSKPPSRRASTASAAAATTTKSPARSRSGSISAKEKKASPARASPRRASAGTRSPSPAKASTPARKKAKKASSTPRARSSSKARRSNSRSASRARATAAARQTPTGTPSPKWTVAALKEYAKENAVTVSGLRNKADILAAIRKSS